MPLIHRKFFTIYQFLYFSINACSQTVQLHNALLRKELLLISESAYEKPVSLRSLLKYEKLPDFDPQVYTG